MNALPLLILAATLAEMPASQPIFALSSADGAVSTGPIRSVAADWTIGVGGAKPTTVSGADLVMLRQVEERIPPPPNQPSALFVNGDRLAGKVIALDEDRIRFRVDDWTPESQEIALPLPYLSAIWFKTPRGEPLPATRERDEVLLANNDLLRGSLLNIDVKGNVFEFRSVDSETPTKLDPGVVRRLAFGTGLARELTPDGPAVRLITRDGSRITLASARLKGDALDATTLFDAKLTIPLREIVLLERIGGRAVPISDLKPTKYESEAFNGPYQGSKWPVSWAANATADRQRLLLGGDFHDKGIGMRGQSRLTFDLAGEYSRFDAIVGTDDRAGRAGRARVRVLVDGKPVEVAGLPNDRDLTGKDGPVAVRIPLKGAKQLTLEVGFARDGGALSDERNLVSWVDARLIREK